ncbi:MAG: 6-phosphogluconolactonase [Verrucomicrobiales bacterium]|nr:6-phosphogluconolactonase [Verrucomicrobiales bacterium]
MSLLAPTASIAGDHWHVYFGCYTNAKTGAKGIHLSEFNSATGTLTEPVVAAETASPSFLAIHPDGKFLYSVGESATKGKKGGPVSAFAINKADGTLKLINQADSGGDGPCHISLDATGRMAMVANYGGGSVASYQIKDDGSVSGPVTFAQHEGSSVNPQRQKGPHAHSFNRSPDNRYGFVCDLGLDKVLTYQIDPAAGSFKLAGETVLPPGTGPRHFAFHPSGKFAFVNGEMLMNVSTLTYAADSGKFTLVSSASTLPPEDQDKPGFSTAETVAHPNGKNVYVSNRTHDTIAVFSCDPETGKLTLIQNAPAGGKIPRNFSLDPTGRWMIVGHQDSNTAVVLKVDPDTGKLSPTDTKIKVGGAVCVRFLAAD